MRRRPVRNDVAYVRELRREVDRYRTKLREAEAEIARIGSESAEQIAALTVRVAEAKACAREAEARLEAVL